MNTDTMLKSSTSFILRMTLFAALMLSALTVAPARAQTEGPGRFKLVFGFPTDGDTSKVTGNPIFGFGLQR